MRIRHGAIIESIQPEYTLSDGTTSIGSIQQGGTSQREIRIPFQTDYELTEVRVLTDEILIYGLTFITTDGSGNTQGYSTHGMTGLIPFTVQERVIAFYGRSGGLLDAIGFYYIGWFLHVASA